VTWLGWLGPAQPYGPGWARPERKKKEIFFKNYFKKKYVIFPRIFLLNFAKYWLVFLYRKDTNPVLKYLVFIKNIEKKYFCFNAYDQVSQRKNHTIFSYNKNSKICINLYFGFNNYFLKSRELGQYFKNSKKIIFSFSVWGYDLICKTYSGKLFIVQEKQFWCEHTPMEL
jgi:hypothetical protein